MWWQVQSRGRSLYEDIEGWVLGASKCGRDEATIHDQLSEPVLLDVAFVLRAVGEVLTMHRDDGEWGVKGVKVDLSLGLTGVLDLLLLLLFSIAAVCLNMAFFFFKNNGGQPSLHPQGTGMVERSPKGGN